MKRFTLALFMLLALGACSTTQEDGHSTGAISESSDATSIAGDGDGDTGEDTSGSSADGDESSGAGPKFDVVMDPDLGSPEEECLPCSIELDTKQSGTLEALAMVEFMGAIELQNQIMYALLQDDGGRMIFSADSNIIYGEGGDCPLWAWLGASGQSLPRVLTFGALTCDDGVIDQHAAPPAFPEHQFSAGHLPAEYIGDAAALKADWDVVVFCEAPMYESDELSPEEVQTLVDYAQLENGGLYLISEFLGYLSASDVVAVNLIATQLGVEFLPTNLDWGNAGGVIDFECFPVPEG